MFRRDDFKNKKLADREPMEGIYRRPNWVRGISCLLENYRYRRSITFEQSRAVMWPDQWAPSAYPRLVAFEIAANDNGSQPERYWG